MYYDQHGAPHSSAEQRAHLFSGNNLPTHSSSQWFPLEAKVTSLSAFRLDLILIRVTSALLVSSLNIIFYPSPLRQYNPPKSAAGFECGAECVKLALAKFLRKVTWVMKFYWPSPHCTGRDEDQTIHWEVHFTRRDFCKYTTMVLLHCSYMSSPFLCVFQPLSQKWIKTSSSLFPPAPVLPTRLIFCCVKFCLGY